MLAEKGIDHETVLVDLDDRPDWMIELNPPDGRVPVLEESGLPLIPESRVIIRYLDDRFPEPALMPDTPEERALVDLAIERFDGMVSNPYYELKSGRAGDEGLAAGLAAMDAVLSEQDYLVGSAYSLADITYVPWILRAEALLGVAVRDYPSLAAWLARLEERAAIQAEAELVGQLVA